MAYHGGVTTVTERPRTVGYRSAYLKKSNGALGRSPVDQDRKATSFFMASREWPNQRGVTVVTVGVRRLPVTLRASRMKVTHWVVLRWALVLEQPFLPVTWRRLSWRRSGVDVPLAVVDVEQALSL